MTSGAEAIGADVCRRAGGDMASGPLAFGFFWKIFELRTSRLPWLPNPQNYIVHARFAVGYVWRPST